MCRRVDYDFVEVGQQIDAIVWYQELEVEKRLKSGFCMPELIP